MRFSLVKRVKFALSAGIYFRVKFDPLTGFLPQTALCAFIFNIFSVDFAPWCGMCLRNVAVKGSVQERGFYTLCADI